MKLIDIDFGKIDAKNELTDNSDEQKIAFEQSYLVPEYVDFDSLENGNKYIISGLKGIGKTALLHYVDIKLRKRANNVTSFILFKSEFTSEERKKFYRDSQSVIDDSEIKENNNAKDYEWMWKWFFLNYIYNCVKDDLNSFFINDNAWKSFSKCIQCVEMKDDSIIIGLTRLLPHIKRGQVKIGNPKIALDIGIEVGEGGNYQFWKLVKKAEELFLNLKIIERKRLYLLVDELEISYEVKKQYERDIRIIRDLIVTTEKMNALSRRLGYKIYIIASVRSEVLNVINSVGKEINKCVEDFGIQIVWHYSSESKHIHPLIQMIMKRLVANEGIEDTPENREIMWKQYFPEQIIQSLEIERYILYNSWYRPRDIVRMLTAGKTSFPNADSFSHKVFDGIRKSYSEKSWIECMEELKAIYNNEEIDLIGELFCGWKPYFSKNDIQYRLSKLSSEDSRFLNASLNINKLLEDLYRVGVIGNRYKIRDEYDEYKIRFIFRGDSKLLLDKGMMIHNALRPYFSL